jgi:hypothetical protein
VYGASEEYARDKPYERYERKGGSWWEEREQRDQNSHGGREYERHRDWAQRTERAGQVGQAQKRHSSALVPSPPLTPRRRRGVKGKGVWRHENASMEAATQRDKYSFDALVVAVQYSSPVSDSEVCTPVAEGMSRPEASGSKPMRESTPEGIPAGTVRGTPVMSERKKLPPTAAAAMPPPALPMGPNTDNDLSVLLMAQRQGPWMHPLPAGLIEHVPKDSEESFEPVSGMVVKGRLFTDSILAMGPYVSNQNNWLIQVADAHDRLSASATIAAPTRQATTLGAARSVDPMLCVVTLPPPPNSPNFQVCNKCGLHETSRGEARPGKAEDHHAVYTVRKLLDRPLGNPSKGLPLPRDLKRKAKYVPKKSAVGAGDAGDAGGTGAAPVKAKAKPKSRLGKNVVLAGSALDEAPVLAPAPVPVATPAPAKEVIAPLEEMLFPTGCHLGDLGLDRDDGAPVKRSKSF